ncbi:MAG: antibiotic biosynthesis monooxygenase [Deltaproteobacteria bacterium]|nr:antibiotic biosynthesis monooxygenase [Deltaproteobacteria bacterium]
MRRTFERVLLPAVAGLSLLALVADGSPARGAASRPGAPAIARCWHGKTTRDRADAYEKILAAAIARFPGIPGNRGYQLMRLDGGPDGEAYVEFQVISYWDSLEAIRGYAGDDVRRTRDLPQDGEYLVDREPHVRNYQLRIDALRP